MAPTLSFELTQNHESSIKNNPNNCLDDIDNQGTKPVVCWTPSNPNTTLLYKYCEYLGKFGVNFDPSKKYSSLHEWSINNINLFWSSIWSFTNMISQHSPDLESIISRDKSMYPPSKWFKNTLLNYAENLLESISWSSSSEVAVIQVMEPDIQNSDHHTCFSLTINDLKDQVRRMAICLDQVFKVQMGDIVAAYAGNRIEVLILMLASASLGATFTSISPDFGPGSVLQRFGQLSKPLKVILTQSIARYNGKSYDHLDKIYQVMNDWDISKSSFPRIILISNDDITTGHINSVPVTTWNDCMAITQHYNYPISYAQVPFDHPLFILYSSGSTGTPKCIVHGTGGILLQHKKEHMLHGNIHPGNVLFQMTTIAWMMWHWSSSALSVGACIVLYDGSPWVSNATFLWRQIISKHRVTHFGTSAKYLALLEEKIPTIAPDSLGDISKLECIFSTGSPLTISSFKYVYEHIKKDVHLASITGGTDILSLFAGGNPTAPVYLGQIQCKCLGMDVQVWDENGNRIDDKGFKKGDLVCTQPFPCMPVYFDADTTGFKYKEAYFMRFPGVWWHGDFIAIDNHTNGGIEMFGRSDGTLNPGGVRFGSAEIYQVLIGLFCESGLYQDQGMDALVVGKKKNINIANDCDEQVILFIKTNLEWTECLVEKINQAIRIQLSPRHVPSYIIQVQDIPYTMNGKKAEVVIKKVLSVNNLTKADLEKLAQGLERPELIFVYYQIGKELN